MATTLHARRPRIRPSRRDAALTLSFTVAYVLAAYLGRRTVVHGGGVSLIWPAAGVSVVWLISRARRPWPWLDVLAIYASTFVVVRLTDATAGLAAIGALAATLQAVVCCLVVAARCPGLWSTRGTRPLGNAELWWFLLAAGGSSLVSAPLAGLAVALQTHAWSWDVVLLWCARNTVAIVTIGTLGFLVADAFRRRASKQPRPAPAVAIPTRRRAEWIAALALSPVVYVAWLLGLHSIGFVFPLIALTVWAGARLPSPLVVVHNTTAAVVVIGLTLLGYGPFLQLGTATTQVGVAQLYVGLVCLLGLCLALPADERALLLHDLAGARDRAQSQAALLATIVDTMAEGVRVVDPNGHVLVRNPAATRLLAGVTRLESTDDTADLTGISRLDGSPLPADELPYRQALAGREVRDLDLLVHTPGTSTSRIVAFTSARIPDQSGGGVVTVLRDVTAERQELARAARIQASLLPRRIPSLPGYQLAARFVPAGSVGGDFYDWHPVKDGLVLTLADVMGKGPGAAILAATTRSILQAHADDTDVAGTLQAAEHAMARDLVSAGAFVTVIQVHLHASAGMITYSDAGHGLSFVVKHEGASYRLPATGLPLGVGLDDPRTAGTAQLEPGDTLLIFSDGVLDAAGGTVADLSRFEQTLKDVTSADEAVDTVLALAQQESPQDDDLTVIALRRLAAS